MAKVREAQPVYFFASILYRKDLRQQELLKQIFEAKLKGPIISFHHSFFPMKNYYSSEMGNEQQLERVFFVSLQKENREKIVELKKWTHERELSTSVDNNKRVENWDIGFVSKEQMALATHKGFSHRIYLSQGVYLDLTYINQEEGFKTLSWTYPDYSHPEILEFFNYVRKML